MLRQLCFPILVFIFSSPKWLIYYILNLGAFSGCRDSGVPQSPLARSNVLPFTTAALGLRGALLLSSLVHHPWEGGGRREPSTSRAAQGASSVGGAELELAQSRERHEFPFELLCSDGCCSVLCVPVGVQVIVKDMNNASSSEERRGTIVEWNKENRQYRVQVGRTQALVKPENVRIPIDRGRFSQ